MPDRIEGFDEEELNLPEDNAENAHEEENWENELNIDDEFIDEWNNNPNMDFDEDDLIDEFNEEFNQDPEAEIDRPGIGNQPFAVNLDFEGFQNVHVVNHDFPNENNVIRDPDGRIIVARPIEENRPIPQGNGIVDQIQNFNEAQEIIAQRMRDQINQVRGFDEINLRVRNDWARVYLENYFYKSENEEKYEKMIKTILTKDKRQVVHLQVPANNTDEDEVLLEKWASGKDKFVRQIPFLPSDDKVLTKKVAKLPKGFRKEPKKKINKQVSITLEDFYKKTEKYFTVKSNEYIFNSIYDTSSFKGTIKRNPEDDANSIVAKDIFVMGYTDDNIPYRGITTGRFNYRGNKHTVEVLGFKCTRNPYGIGKFNNTELYDNECKLELVDIHYTNLIVIENTSDLMRIKVKSSKESSIFGFSGIKSKMVGNIYNPSQFKVVLNYNSKKLDKKVDIVDVLTDSGTFVKFLLSDIEFLYLDPEKIGVSISKKDRTIKRGSIVKVRDDRKINLNRNEQVTVLDIKSNISNKRMSKVTVRDTRGEIHNVLLKQIKVI